MTQELSKKEQYAIYTINLKKLIKDYYLIEQKVSPSEKKTQILYRIKQEIKDIYKERKKLIKKPVENKGYKSFLS